MLPYMNLYNSEKCSMLFELLNDVTMITAHIYCLTIALLLTFKSKLSKPFAFIKCKNK